MKAVNVLNVKNRNDFREWLAKYSATEKECWVAVKRGRPCDGGGCLCYLDAVEEALCFGWIDSVMRKIDGVAVQRFSPRRKGSPWTELNKERCRRLERLGLMTDAGRAVLPLMDVDAFAVDEDIKKALMLAGAWDNFIKFPPLYQRIRAYNIAFAKKRYTEAYKRSLAHLIDETLRGRMYGEWNDYDRLSGDFKDGE